MWFLHYYIIIPPFTQPLWCTSMEIISESLRFTNSVIFLLPGRKIWEDARCFGWKCIIQSLSFLKPRVIPSHCYVLPSYSPRFIQSRPLPSTCGAQYPISVTLGQLSGRQSNIHANVLPLSIINVDFWTLPMHFHSDQLPVGVQYALNMRPIPLTT